MEIILSCPQSTSNINPVMSLIDIPKELSEKLPKITAGMSEKQRILFTWTAAINYENNLTEENARCFLDEVGIKHDTISSRVDLYEVAWKNGWRDGEIYSYKGFNIEGSYCPKHYPNPIFPQCPFYYKITRKSKRNVGANRYYTKTFADAKEFINRCTSGKSVKSMTFKANHYIDGGRAHIMANGVWSEYES